MENGSDAGISDAPPCFVLEIAFDSFEECGGGSGSLER